MAEQKLFRILQQHFLVPEVHPKRSGMQSNERPIVQTQNSLKSYIETRKCYMMMLPESYEI